MININSVVLIGRITKDPQTELELRKTQSNISVMQFTIAVNRNFKPEGSDKPDADFIQCIAWRQSADFLHMYGHKGDILSVEGRIQTRNYDNNQGQKVYVTEVVAEHVQIISKEQNNYTAPTPNDNYLPNYGNQNANQQAPIYQSPQYTPPVQQQPVQQQTKQYQQPLVGTDNKTMFGGNANGYGLNIDTDDLPFY